MIRSAVSTTVNATPLSTAPSSYSFLLILQTGECVKTFVGHTDFVKSILLVGKFLFSGSADAHIRQWDTTTGECVRDLKAHTRSVECLAISEDGKKLFSASSDRTIRQWDVESGQVEKVYEGHETNVFALTVWDEELWTGTRLEP